MTLCGKVTGGANWPAPAEEAADDIAAADAADDDAEADADPVAATAVAPPLASPSLPARRPAVANRLAARRLVPER